MSLKNYNLVYDVDQLQAYYECFLQNVAAHIRSYCSIKFMLQSRRKYNINEKQSKCTVTILRRIFDLSNTAAEFVNFVRRFQVEEGLYTDKDKEAGEKIQVPSEALVLYITSNALSRVEATKKVVKKVVNEALFAIPSLKEDDDQEDNAPFYSLDKHFYTELHKSPETKMQRLDVDSQDPAFLAELDQLLLANNADVIFVIRTPNGYHYVMRSGPVMQHLVKFCEKNKTQISMDRNGMNALPGTLQGGKKVQLVFAKGNAKYCTYASTSIGGSSSCSGAFTLPK